MTSRAESIQWLCGQVAGLVIRVGWRGVNRGWRPRPGDRPPVSRDARVVVEMDVDAGVDLVRVAVPGDVDRPPVLVERDDEWCAAARTTGVLVVWAAVWPQSSPPSRILEAILADPKTRWEHVPARRYAEYRPDLVVAPARHAVAS